MCNIIVYHFVYNKTFSICDVFSELEAPYLEGSLGCGHGLDLCEFKLLSPSFKKVLQPCNIKGPQIHLGHIQNRKHFVW